MAKHRINEKGVQLRIAYERAVRGGQPDPEAAAAIRAEAQQEGAGLAARAAVIRDELFGPDHDLPQA